MAKTVSRVDFIADLDGRDLPRQARIIGEKIGQEGSKGFSDSFDRELGGTFERKLTDLGGRFANQLSRQGRLAGSKFSKDFESAVSNNFRSMQRNLAQILSNRESFQEFARGFDTVDEAVDRLRLDLKSLVNQKYKYTDSLGRVREGNALTDTDFKKFSKTVGELGEEFRKVRADEDALAEGQRFMAREIEAANERSRVSMEKLQERHRILTQRIGNVDAFRLYARELGSNAAAHRELSTELDELGRKLKISSEEQQIVRQRLSNTSDAARKQSFEIFDLSKQWNKLGHNTRQWTVIVGVVAAAMQQLAGLGSALGAGLFAVGGGLTAAVGGGGAAVAVFSALAKPLEELPESMRDVAAQGKALGREFQNTGQVIASAAFEQMPDTFDKMNASLRALSPSFSRLGSSVGTVFDDLADGLREGSDGFNELQGLIDNAAADFPALARATGTWGESLMRALNRANPMTKQLIGYIQELGDRFNAFTKSDSFDQWVRTSMQTWTEFGELLDATGRMLNDLVTPDSIVRTQKFLDNLTSFMPHLGNLLDVLGRLDLFGLVAEGLADFGAALEPLYEPAADLADALNEVGSVAIDVLASGLSIAASVAAPLAQALAKIIDAMPPGAVVAISTAVLGLVGAMKLLNGASALAGAANAALIAQGSFGRLAAATGVAEAATSRWSGSLKSIAGKAGLVGGVAVALGMAIPLLKQWGDELNGYDENAKKAAAANLDLDATVRQVVSGNKMYSEAFTTSRSALEELIAVQEGGGFRRWIGDLGQANRESYALSLALGKLDEEISVLPIDAAIEKFSAWAESVNATDAEASAMLAEMPLFKEQLEATAAATGQLATDQDLLKMALSGGNEAVGSQKGAIEGLYGSYGMASSEIDILSGKLRDFAEQNLITRSAARDYEAAVDDLTASVAENGNSLDITTEKGRLNEAAVDRLAEATLKLKDETYAQTGSQKAANDVIDKGRQELIKQLAQFGITGQKAEEYADKLGLIPDDIATRVALKDAERVEAQLQNLARARTASINVVMGGGGYDIGNMQVRPYASGGTVHGPTRALIGEAGPEAVVPLNRPLSQVDPSVRMLSAIAQGKTPQMASGGIVGTPSKTYNFEPGAIVVNEASSPLATGVEILDRIVADMD